jgi:hypothetical protein
MSLKEGVTGKKDEKYLSYFKNTCYYYNDFGNARIRCEPKQRHIHERALKLIRRAVP